MKLSLEADVAVWWEVDEVCDLGHIGRYTEIEEPGAIDCKVHSRGWTNKQYRYFVSCNHSTFDPKDWNHVHADEISRVISVHGSLEKATQAYAMQDFERMEAYNRGEWGMRACFARATIGGISDRVSLHGIESDGKESYFKSIEDDLTADALSRVRKQILKLISDGGQHDE